MPRISVIVPVYNVEPYICRCVDSILNQTFADFELILIDDGSPDNCGSICDEYAIRDNRITVIHKENGGLSSARNAGIDWIFANSDSEWITFIDSDDWVHPQFLEILLDTAESNSVEISCCGYQRVSEIDKPELVRIVDREIETGNAIELFRKRYNFNVFNIIIAPTRLYKKYLFESIRFPVGRYYEDSYTTYKVLLACSRISLVKSIMYYYFYNLTGIMGSSMTVRKMDDTFDSYLEKLDLLFKNKYIDVFQYFFREYCYKLERYYKEYNVPEYCDVLIKYKKKTKELMIQYKDALPTSLKKFGYKKWVNGRADKLEAFEKDTTKICSEKGFLFSLLWAVKNYWNV